MSPAPPDQEQLDLPRCLVCGESAEPSRMFDGWCATCAGKALEDVLRMRDLEQGQRVIMAELLRYAQAPFIAGVVAK